MPRVVHFEVHAEDPERATRFYTELFGWTITQWGGPVDYRVITTGPDGQPGINGGMVRRMGPGPTDGQAVNAYVCTVDVESVDETLERAVALGGTVAHPKMPIPGVGWLAYAKDTEGNIFGIMQNDPSAG
ncbi:MAG TPA: VOC family protein [Longimicrobium sp.]|nr:VOC family protein [Longimicrobium sp.]